MPASHNCRHFKNKQYHDFPLDSLMPPPSQHSARCKYTDPMVRPTPDEQMNITYRINEPVTAEQCIELLVSSGLGERRPVDDVECITGMIKHSNLLVTAWNQDLLVGMSRSVTDFHYSCYLSDLAVHLDYQKRGIGIELQLLTQQQLGPKCRIILLAAPGAKDYYQRLGYTHNPRAWVLERDQTIRVTPLGT